MLGWIKRLAGMHVDARLQKEVERLTFDLQAIRVELRIRELEVEHLSAVCARDRERVKAETATAARVVAAFPPAKV